MQLGNVRKTESGSCHRLPSPHIFEAGLRAVLAVWFLLGPTLGMAQVSRSSAPLKAKEENGIKVSVLNFQDESGTGATEELGRWLAGYLAKDLSYSSKRALSSRFFDWRNDPSSIKEWPRQRLVAHGQRVRAQYVVRAGLLSASSDSLPGKLRTRIQLYAEIVSVDAADDARVEASGLGYQQADEVDAIVAWDSIDLRSERFRRSSIRNALADGIKRLASEIDSQIRSSSTNGEQGGQDGGTDRQEGQVAQRVLPNEDHADTGSTPEVQEAVADEAVQQLLAQAQECLNSVNASREKLDALIQALQGLTSAMEQKVRLLEDGRVGETAGVDGLIGTQANALQQSVDQLLPEQPDAASPGGAPLESGGGSSWFDKVTKAVDFGFSVFERVLDLRDRLRGFQGASYPGAPGVDASVPEGSVGDIPSEEPFLDVNGTVFTTGDGTQGRLGDGRPQLVPAVLSVAGGYRERVVLAALSANARSVPSAMRITYTGAAGLTRQPVAAAEVIEPDSGASARTDRNGVFSVRVPARSRRLIVKVGGLQVGERRISLVAGRAMAADFVVSSRAGTTTAGRILPSRVVVEGSATNTGAITGLVQDAQGRPASRALVEVGRLAMARTDSRGRFVFAKVPAGSQQLTVRAGDLEPRSQQVRVTANASTETTIRLGSTRRSQGAGERLVAPGAGTFFRGEVTEGQNRPLSGAMVSVIGSSSTITARSSAIGRFELKDLKPGSYRVLVSKPGYSDVTQSISLRPGGNEPASFRMTQSNSKFDREVAPRLMAAMGEVRGQVRGADRRPIANAIVELRASGNTSGGDRVVTNARGEYALKALQGRYELRVLQQRYQAYSSKVELRARDSVRADVELKENSGASTVRGSKGERSDGSLRGPVTDDQNHKAVPGGRSGIRSQETLRAQLRGRVLDDRTGKPISGARVSVQGRSDVTDNSGSYRIDDLPVGRLQIAVAKAGYAGASTAVEIKAGTMTNRNFDLKPMDDRGKDDSHSRGGLGQVRGRVVDDKTGKPISGARVSVDGRGDTTDQSGGFGVSGVSAGRHSVIVGKPGYSSESSSVEVKNGASATVNVELRYSGRSRTNPGRTLPHSPSPRPNPLVKPEANPGGKVSGNPTSGLNRNSGTAANLSPKNTTANRNSHATVNRDTGEKKPSARRP